VKGEKLGAANAGYAPIAKTATCFRRGHCCRISSVMGIRAVMTTSASFIRSTMVFVSDGVVGYSV
jgi:hypothetical protein